MHSVQVVIKNILWGFSGGVATGLFAFIGSIFVARNLDVESYGILQLATTYYIFLQLLENFANQNVTKIEMIKNKNDSWQIACGTGQVIFICYSLVLCLLGIAYFFIRSDILFYVILMTAGQLFRSGMGIVNFFDVHLETQWSQISTAFGSFVQSGYRILASFNGQILWQSFGIAVGNFSSLVSLMYFLKKNYKQNKFRIVSAERCWDIFYKSYPMVIITLVSMLIYKLDVVILGYYGQTEQISFYSNAVKFAEPWNFVAASIIGAMVPNAIKNRAISIGKYYRYLRYLFFILTVTAVGLGIVVSLFSKFIILHTYGSKYLESASMLRIHIWSNVFLFWMLAQQIWEVNEGLKKFLFFKTSLGVVINFFLNMTLIPKYGGMGCVVASLATYFFVAFVGNLFHRKARFFAWQLLKAIFDGEAVIFFWKILQARIRGAR